jgi:hypothetical protein
MNDYAKKRVESLVSQLQAQGYDQMAARIGEAADNGDLRVNYVGVKNGAITRGIDLDEPSRQMTTTFEITVTTS